MSYTIIPFDNSFAHGLVRIIVDKDSDVDEVPKTFSVGSKVIVAESGKTYLLNNKRE